MEQPVRVLEQHRRALGVEVDDLGVAYAEPNVSPISRAGLSQIDEDRRLGIEPARLAHEALEVDAMAGTGEPEVDAAMRMAVARVARLQTPQATESAQLLAEQIEVLLRMTDSFSQFVNWQLKKWPWVLTPTRPDGRRSAIRYDRRPW